MTTSMVGLEKKGHIHKNLTQKGEPQRSRWGTQKRRNTSQRPNLPSHPITGIDAEPTCPSTDAIGPGAWQASHKRVSLLVIVMSRPRKSGIDPHASPSPGGHRTTGPEGWWSQLESPLGQRGGAWGRVESAGVSTGPEGWCLGKSGVSWSLLWARGVVLGEEWSQLESPLGQRGGAWGRVESAGVSSGPEGWWSQLESPLGQRGGGVSWSQLESPLGQRGGGVSWSLLWARGVVESAGVSSGPEGWWSQLESPLGQRGGGVSWSLHWARGVVLGEEWSQLESPLGQRGGGVSWSLLWARGVVLGEEWSQLESPLGQRGGSWGRVESAGVFIGKSRAVQDSFKLD